MAVHQAPPTLGFSRQEHWSGLPFPSPMQESEKWKGSRSVVSDSSQPHGLQPTRLLRPWGFPGKSAGVGCHCLLRVMNYRVCIQLVAGSWIGGIPIQIGQTGQIFSLPFCDSNLINHFFCDIPPILKLACGDTFLNEMLVFTVSALFVLVPFLLILVSYGKIISTVLKLPSATSRGKAFSTCSSHLTVVALFFGSGLVTYLRPRTQGSAGTDKVLSLFYLIVTPVFNPMIYSLRNKDVMMALRQWPCKYLNSLKNWLVFQKLISYIFVINFQYLS